jgi:hypothetical protein
MKIREIYTKLHEFVVAATGFSADKVIFANQIGNVRPIKPFITISCNSFRSIGTPIARILDDSGKMKTIVSMVFAVSFQGFSDLAHDAEEILSDLYIQFSTDLQNQIFRGKLAAQKTLKHTSAIPTILNNQTESRAILEMEMGYFKETINDVGLIESIELKGSVDKATILIKERIGQEN